MWKMTKTSKRILFRPTYSSSGWWVAGSCPGSSEHKAGTSSGQNALPPRVVPTPTSRPTQIGTILTCQFASWAQCSGVWGNGAHLEKTHTDMGSTWQLHIDSGSAWELNVFLIDVCNIKQCYLKTCSVCMYIYIYSYMCVYPQYSR